MRRKKKFPKKEKIYDLVDKNDVFIRRGTRTEARKLGLWRRVVHLFVFNRRGELLVCKRPSWSRSYPSLITSSAGGKVEAGETYHAAARRELKEELEISPPLRAAGIYHVKSRSHGKVLHKLFLAHANGVSPDKKEISEARFASPNRLAREIKLRPRRFALPFIKAFDLYFKIGR